MAVTLSPSRWQRRCRYIVGQIHTASSTSDRDAVPDGVVGVAFSFGWVSELRRYSLHRSRRQGKPLVIQTGVMS